MLLAVDNAIGKVSFRQRQAAAVIACLLEPQGLSPLAAGHQFDFSNPPDDRRMAITGDGQVAAIIASHVQDASGRMCHQSILRWVFRA
jgi:hypothetical protein